MKGTGPYATAEAFRQGLETRLMSLATERGIALDRLRRSASFDRLLARLFAEPSSSWLLKGGYAMELRLGRLARATRDLDLSVPVPPVTSERAESPIERVARGIREAAARDLDDCFFFRIPGPHTPLHGPPQGGARLPVECHVAGRLFDRFKLDFGVGDRVDLPPEMLPAGDLLGFAGVPPVRVPVVHSAIQFAEKIHAYTLPRPSVPGTGTTRENTRVRDLVDLALLLGAGPGSPEELRLALDAAFSCRGTHEMPSALPAAPDSWRAPFEELARTAGLDPPDLDRAFSAVAEFYASLVAAR